MGALGCNFCNRRMLCHTQLFIKNYHLSHVCLFPILTISILQGLYAECPKTDKIKISRAIVRAVRELGGRFLEVEERSGVYHDIGDKRAVEKTSQALREKQTQIRQKLYSKKRHSDETILYEMSTDGYALYSMQVLQRLRDGDGIGLDLDLESAWAAASHQQNSEQRLLRRSLFLQSARRCCFRNQSMLH